MGHGKLKKFEENKSFGCLLQPSIDEVFDHNLSSESGLHLLDHPIKGHWNEKMFAENRPVILELGCGKGEYAIDLSKRNPEFNYIGVDIKGARLWKGAKTATGEALTNVAFLRTRIEFIESFFASSEVSEIWLTFSDPQIKSENNRLTSPLFLNRYRHFLKEGGIIHLKTDSMFLHEYTKAMCSANSLSVLACTEDLYASDRTGLYSSELASVCGESAVDALFQVQTYYEQMFINQGFKITYMAFTIDHNGDYVSPEWDSEYWKAKELPRITTLH